MVSLSMCLQADGLFTGRLETGLKDKYGMSICLGDNILFDIQGEGKRTVKAQFREIYDNEYDQYGIGIIFPLPASEGINCCGGG